MPLYYVDRYNVRIYVAQRVACRTTTKEEIRKITHMTAILEYARELLARHGTIGSI